MEKQLTDEKIKIVRIALMDFPHFSSGAITWHKIGSEIIFNNINLSKKVINTFAVLDNEQTYYCTVRRDGDNIDVDRYFMSLDRSCASGAFVQSVPIKNFPEHHNPESYNLL